MKVNIQTKGIIITSKQKSVMERKLLKLKRYVKDFSPVNCDVKLIDQTGEGKGGVDQAVHINISLPKETIFVEEVDDRIVRAFGFAYKIVERRLRRYNQKYTYDRRRKSSKFKSVVNVVGAPIRAAGSAGRFVGGTIVRIVPKRKRKKRK